MSATSTSDPDSLALGDAALLPRHELPRPRFFSRGAPLKITSCDLPHWSQPGCTVFVTWRTADSLPQEKLTSLRAEREAYLLAHPKPWSAETMDEYIRLFEGRFQTWLDRGLGACPMSDAAVRRAVEDVILRLDGERYAVYAFVVMSNHVHVLFMPLGDELPADILRSWKGVSARVVNRMTRRAGALWQKESWDHLVRGPIAFDRFLAYIRANDPEKAYVAWPCRENAK